MSTVELRKRLIDKIQTTKDERILEEAYRLLEIETKDIEIYRLSDDQKNLLVKPDSRLKTENF